MSRVEGLYNGGQYDYTGGLIWAPLGALTNQYPTFFKEPVANHIPAH